MTIIELYSKRQKRIRGDVPDVYVYDDVPRPLRVQIISSWQDALGNRRQYRDGKVSEAYKFIVKTLCREYGVFDLPLRTAHPRANSDEILENFFLHVEDIEKVFDVVELAFKVIDRMTREYTYLHRDNHSRYANDAIEELNARFKEHGVGYQFVDGEIIRVDSELIHVEAVKPALRLLNSENYEGAQDEFLGAYEHYRHGKNKEALNDCLKSFESTMKSICDKRGWQYPSNATSKALIDVCFKNELVPQFWQQQLGSLRSMLESSIPTGRNKLGGHGQGAAPVTVPDHLTAYMLHMTASTLVFLVNAELSLN